jgi:hypothetical protein
MRTDSKSVAQLGAMPPTLLGVHWRGCLTLPEGRKDDLMLKEGRGVVWTEKNRQAHSRHRAACARERRCSLLEEHRTPSLVVREETRWEGREAGVTVG